MPSTHLEAGGVDDADVGGHAVAEFALDDVAAHEVRRVARHRLPVADHGGHLRAARQHSLMCESLNTLQYMLYSCIQSTLYSRVVQTCGSGTKFGSLGQNFCIHFVLSYF